MLRNDTWRAEADSGTAYRQGYLCGPGGAAEAGAGKASVRVRAAGNAANINIKSAQLGVRRSEFEYAIPVDDAAALLALCEGVIEKRRYRVSRPPHVWEIDVFEGDNAGLVVAEIELGHEDEAFERPSWLGEEVSHDPRYYNVCLVAHPYKGWPRA